MCLDLHSVRPIPCVFWMPFLVSLRCSIPVYGLVGFIVLEASGLWTWPIQLPALASTNTCHQLWSCSVVMFYGHVSVIMRIGMTVSHSIHHYSYWNNYTIIISCSICIIHVLSISYMLNLVMGVCNCVRLLQSS